ncbi:hypothetical protein ACFQV2_17130 [Actinokineospora soli]|uniref:Secreted protein n=1 Tax=Actinokineospora soli TaxID=1048753 RepID=A0ABW2TQD4_9PSEU
MTIEQSTPSDAPKKPSVLRRVLGFVVALVVAGAVAYGINYFGSDAAQTKAGDCASLTGTSSDADFKTVDCGAPEANYTVGKVLSSTGESCGENYDQYTETARRGPDSKLCLVPRLESGKCHDFDSTGMGYPVIECTASNAVMVKTVASEAECADGKALAYTEPKTIYCLTAPTES